MGRNIVMEPKVVAVMLTRDRDELTRRAIAAFERQVYKSKTLAILDTSAELIRYEGHFQQWVIEEQAHSIGYLRNMGNALLDGDIVIHWDSDDYSSPDRISEQVAFLQDSGADVVGYSQMLFWREPNLSDRPRYPGDRGEAWLYTATKGCAPALGTSLVYWRKTWERNPFPDQPTSKNSGSEYGNWLKALKCETVPAFNSVADAPRMVARIHAGNAARHSYDLEKLVANGSNEWKRVPDWDSRVKQIMEGK